jgi:hypothetical protein
MKTENLFAPYELAKTAKEKGFDEPCFCYYDCDGKLNMTLYEIEDVVITLAIKNLKQDMKFSQQHLSKHLN